MDKYKIAIDAGHGSNTAGKRTPDGYREHWINVRHAHFFEKACKRCGFATVRIGWDDTNAKDDLDVTILARQKAIRAADVDISVSWHANAYGDGKTYNGANGVVTYIHSVSSKQKDSKSLADLVQAELIRGTAQKNRGVKTGNFGVCNATYMRCKAAILIESAFMTNSREAELLKTDKFCQEQAEDACRGICKYLGVNYVKPGSVAVKYKVATNGARLALRAVAGARSKLIRYVSNGSTVVGTGKSCVVQNSKWLQVTAAKTTGWMHSGYLKRLTE